MSAAEAAASDRASRDSDGMRTNKHPPSTTQSSIGDLAVGPLPSPCPLGPAQVFRRIVIPAGTRIASAFSTLGVVWTVCGPSRALSANQKQKRNQMTNQQKLNPQAAVTASGAVTEPATEQSASAAEGSKASTPPSVNRPPMESEEETSGKTWEAAAWLAHVAGYSQTAKRFSTREKSADTGPLLFNHRVLKSCKVTRLVAARALHTFKKQ